MKFRKIFTLFYLEISYISCIIIKDIAKYLDYFEECSLEISTPGRLIIENLNEIQREFYLYNSIRFKNLIIRNNYISYRKSCFAKFMMAFPNLDSHLDNFQLNQADGKIT